MGESVLEFPDTPENQRRRFKRFRFSPADGEVRELFDNLRAGADWARSVKDLDIKEVIPTNDTNSNDQD